jgi:hypothetical protein
MVGIFVNNYVVRTGPAPVGRERPVIRENFKAETSVEPETVVIPVNPVEAKMVLGAEICKATVFIGTIHMKPGVIPVIVPVPSVVANVRPLIYSSVRIGVMLRRATLRPSLRGRGNPTAISAVHLAISALRRSRALLFATALSKCGRSKYEDQHDHWAHKLLHKTSIF